MPLVQTTNILNILQKGGFDRKQAETIVEAIAAAHRDSDAVTNSSLDLRLKEMEVRLIKWTVTVVGVGVAILALLIQF